MHQTMSVEQRTTLDYIRAGYNVKVDACAGSGKSTTILSIAQELTGLQIRQFTYNSMLRHEVKEKIKELDLDNLTVHTYHSFTVKHYSDMGHTDTGIRHVLRENLPPRTPINHVDLLVLDECQDMTPLYFQLIVKMSKDMFSVHTKPFQLLVLGDYMQGLYEFKGADIRFLTEAATIWQTLPYLQTTEFRECSLKTSYRVTNQIAKFVNRDMLGQERLLAKREGCQVVYINRPRWQIETIVVYQIKTLLQEGESPSDIFILGSSITGPNSDIRHMENCLTENNIPCHVPMNDVTLTDDRVIDGKVVFSTFHTVKGRQRKYVFVVGFDQGYFFNTPNLDTSICPNTLYVAATRATHKLFLLVNDRSRPLIFLKYNHHEMNQSDYIDFKGIPKIRHEKVQEQSPDQAGIVTIPVYDVTPTKLIKFVNETVLEEITPILERIFVKQDTSNRDQDPIEGSIEIPKIVKTSRGLYEDVSDLNGLTIPTFYFDHVLQKTQGSDTLKQIIRTSVQDMADGKHVFLRKAVENIPSICETIQEYLYLANVYVAVQEKLYSKLKQIHPEEYEWLTPYIMDQCIRRMNYHLGQELLEKDPKTIEVETLLIHRSQEAEHMLIDAALNPFFYYDMRVKFTARLDLLTQNTLWELKCTSKVSLDHFMQTAIYAWLWRVLNPNDPRECKIVNIQTGEVYLLAASTEELITIVVALLRGKYEKTVPITNEEFLGQCQKTIRDICNIKNDQAKEILQNVETKSEKKFQMSESGQK